MGCEFGVFRVPYQVQMLTAIGNHDAGFCRKIKVLSSFLLMMAPKFLKEKAREKMTEDGTSNCCLPA